MQHASRYQFIYSIVGLALGFVCVICGLVLFLHGIGGASSWTASVLGANSTATDVAPGGLLFVIGLFVVVATRLPVTAKG